MYRKRAEVLMAIDKNPVQICLLQETEFEVDSLENGKHILLTLSERTVCSPHQHEDEISALPGQCAVVLNLMPMPLIESIQLTQDKPSCIESLDNLVACGHTLYLQQQLPIKASESLTSSRS